VKPEYSPAGRTFSKASVAEYDVANAEEDKSIKPVIRAFIVSPEKS
jgi:hypothetical protein